MNKDVYCIISIEHTMSVRTPNIKGDIMRRVNLLSSGRYGYGPIKGDLSSDQWLSHLHLLNVRQNIDYSPSYVH